MEVTVYQLRQLFTDYRISSNILYTKRPHIESAHLLLRTIVYRERCGLYFAVVNLFLVTVTTPLLCFIGHVKNVEQRDKFRL